MCVHEELVILTPIFIGEGSYDRGLAFATVFFTIKKLGKNILIPVNEQMII